MSFRKLILLAPLALITACGSKAACEDYFEAAEACYAELGGDTGVTVTLDLDGYCDTDAAAEIDKADFTCAADAYNDADCATLEGITAATTAVAACLSAG